MLDNLLKEKAFEALQTRQSIFTDFENWTAANRDQKMASMRDVGSECADVAIDYLKSLLENSLEEKPLVWYFVYMTMIDAEIQFLQNMWEEYCTSTDEDLKILSVDPDWITLGIRDRYKLLGDLAFKLETKISSALLPDVEEL